MSTTKRPKTPEHLPWRRLIGSDTKLRLRMAQQLLSTGLVLANAVVLAYAVRLTGSPWSMWGLWAALALGTQGLILLAIRLGWTHRLKDPSLSVPQIALMLTLTAAAYPLAGPLRSLVVPVMMLVLAFGMFQPPGPALLRLSYLALALAWAAMAFDYWVWPRTSAFSENFGHLLFTLVCFPGLALLAARLVHLRARLKEQHQSRNEALSRIHRLATRDDLTGLYNRRHGKHVLQQALQRQRRTRAGLLAVVLDLDHFKKINDTQGHAAGDAVLRCFAKALKESLRKGDTAVRWGGEEFVVVLEPSTGGGLLAWVARLKLALERQPLVRERPELRFTFSGGSSISRSGDTLESWLERADQALYRAKGEGRDRVLSAD